MEKTFVPRAAASLLCLALVLCLVTACGKKNEPPPAPSPSPASASPSAPGPSVAPAITGKVTPAIVTQNADSITHYLHFPEDPAAARRNSVVQFYCDVNDEGVVEATYGMVGRDEAFIAAVQSALDWGHFAPATVDGTPVGVFLGGTVIFTHDKGQPLIVVSLSTYDRERVAKLTNYIQPQLVGGLRHEIEKVIRQIRRGLPVAGRAETIVKLDEHGAVLSTSPVAESPQGSGLQTLLNNAAKGAQYIHAFQNGKPVAGAVNVVADFSEL